MLFRREIKRNLKSFLISTFICSLLIVYLVSMSPKFGTDIKQLLDMKFPEEMQLAFGMNGLDFNQANSFFAICFSYIYLFISIYIATIFATIVSKEFSDKTAEFLFSLPRRRINLILTKLAVALLYSFAAILIIFLVSCLSFAMIIKENYTLQPIVLMSVAWFLGGITFGGIALLISSFVTKSKTSSSVSVGIVLVMYLFQIVISLNPDIDFLKYISPFDWFTGSEINNTGELSFTYCLIAIFISSISIFIGIRRFKKMDVLV